MPFGEFIEDRIETEVFKDGLWAVVGEEERAGLDLVSDCHMFAAGNYSDVVVYYFFRLTGLVPTADTSGTRSTRRCTRRRWLGTSLEPCR